MIKCKLAGVDGCPKNKECCCFECDEFGKCSSACGEEDPSKCDDAIIDGSTELEVFQNKYLAAMKAVAAVSAQKKALEEKEKEMKSDLLAAMEKFGIKSVDNDVVKITYVASSNGRKIDSANLKKEMPKIYEQFSTPTFKDAYLTIKVK